MARPKHKVIERRTAKSIIRSFFTFFLNDTVNSLVLLFKKNKLYNFDDQKYIGINLGSSTESPPRWIGISGGVTILMYNLPKFFIYLLFPFSGRSKKTSFKEFYQKRKTSKIIHHNLFYGIPYADKCISNVFSSHFFEHLSYESAQFLFSEAYRVLKPGGIIRILVPSLEVRIEDMKKALQACEHGNYEHIQTYITEPYSELMDPFSYHRYMYTISTLKKIIGEAGFTDVMEVKMGEGKMPDLHLLEKRRSIIVEAMKPLN